MRLLRKPLLLLQPYVFARGVAVATVMVSGMLPVVSPAQSFAPVSEFRLKAAFVMNAVTFTEWPASALADGSNIVICIHRDSPMRHALLDLADRPIKGHAIVISSLPEFDAVRPCHVQFLDRVGQGQWSRMKKSIAGSSILTIADQDYYPYEGAIITILRDHQRMMFSVDRKAARDAKIVLSSKFLRLAKSTQ